MPFDFDAEYGDSDDTDEVEEPQPSSVMSADQMIAILNPPQEEEEVPDDYMNEVDKRLEVTSHYRELLRSPLFGSESEAAQIVEREIRRFVRNRIEILLGIRQDVVVPVPPPPQFTEAEVTALKLMAAKLAATPALLKTEKKPAPPTLRPTPPPPPKAAPKVTPQPAPPATKLSVTEVPSAPAPAPARQKPGPKPKAKANGTSLKKKVTRVNPETGESKEMEVEVPRIQRPTGALPWPTDPHAMSAMTEVAAMGSLRTSVSNKGTEAVVTAALKK